MGKRISVDSGERYGKLTVVKEVKEFIQPSGQKQRAFLCKCDCGNKTKVRLSHLRHNRVRSCGCIIGEHHGEVGTKLYNIWRGMKTRSKPYHSESHLYHDRGIDMCDEWENSYLSFKEWAMGNGYSEELTIDRIDNNKGYFPENCRFVTQRVNNANRRNTKVVMYKGEEMPLTLLLRDKGLMDHYNAIYMRLDRGWGVDEAIDTPIRQGDYK